jgi:photosystem II stability/assembly factor-like uncharacterized protein
MRRVYGFILSLLPFLVVGALLYAAMFVKVEPQVSEVPRSLVEARDHFYGVAQAQGQSIWIVGNLGKILHSDDGGTRWRAQESGTREVLQSVHAWSAQDAIAGGEQRVLLFTRDGGNTWARGAIPENANVTRIGRVVGLADGAAIAAGDYGILLRSTDWGASWDVTYQGEDVMWNDLAVREDTILAVGEFGSVLRSTDRGVTWEVVGTPADRSLTSAAFLANGEVVAVGLNGLALFSDDGGQTWQQRDVDTPEHLFVIRAVGEHWLSAGDKGVWVSGEPSGRARVFRLGGFDRHWRTDFALAGTALIAVGEGACMGDVATFIGPEVPERPCRGLCEARGACDPHQETAP